ncbi:MAG: hypothetical protein KGH63_02600 [Candidatus Micrarchaeota archaeon]|nr:hypothetical protein [Candidatus Micrarchaeota archaeon]
MDYKWISLILVGIILLAGCAGNAGAGANANAGANVNANNDNANSGNGNAGANANAGANVNANGNAGSNAVQAAGLLAMEAAGIPTQCTVKVEGQPDSTVYVKGTSLRIETPISPENQTIMVTTIIKGKSAYVDAAALQTPGLNCDWMEINSSMMGNQTAGSGSEPQVSGAADQQTLENLPASSLNCAPAVFGDEKFATPGKVCSFGDILGQAIGSMMNGSVSGSGSADASGSAGADSGGLTAEQKAQVCASITDAQQRQAMGCP